MNLFRIEENEPCLVPARQGFSVLYKKRYLYSRFDPEKAILQQIENLSIQPETLILALSPAAGYGLEKLLEKLPENCHILTVENDPYLFAFYARTCSRAARLDSRVTNTFYTNPLETSGYICGNPFAPSLAHFRRILPITFSGGVDLNPDFYNAVTNAATETLFTFWKNQLTLQHLGKLYTTSCLRNIPAMVSSAMTPFPVGSVNKPILVIGAGPSANETLDWLTQHPEIRDTLYLLSVDAAVTALTSRNLTCNGVVAVESQLAVEKAYIGWKTADTGQPHLFADCASRPAVIRGFRQVSFFATRFCDTTLFESSSWVIRYRNLLNQLHIPQIAPQGSVGNTATEIALLLRADNMPVFVTGVDFSYDAGQTHVKNGPQFTARHTHSSRTKTADNYESAWNDSALHRQGKQNHIQITTPNLEGYATSFAATYHDTPLLFDLGSTGLYLGIPQISLEQVKQFCNSLLTDLNTGFPASEGASTNENLQSGIRLLMQEKERLTAILDSLTHKSSLDTDTLLSLIKDSAYLYMHFPDSVSGVRNDPDFLKRIKAEATWFHKQVTAALNELNQQD